MSGIAHFSEARKSFHAALLQAVVRVDDTGVASNADRHSLYSVRLASGIVSRLGAEVRGARLAAQMSGNRFEEICRAFFENTFLQLAHLRPGTWRILQHRVLGGVIALMKQEARCYPDDVPVRLLLEHPEDRDLQQQLPEVSRHLTAQIAVTP
jgi:hypothetical protein